MNCLVHTVRVSRNNTRTAPADTFFEKKKINASETSRM